MIKLGKLTKDRWKLFKALRLESLKRDPLAFGSSYEEELHFSSDVWKNRIGNVIFAFSDGKPIGMITCLFSERLKTKHVVDIVGVYVTPSLRGQGIGTKLLDRSLQVARRNKRIKVKLAVNSIDRPAVRLYQKGGFVVTGKSKKEFKIGNKYYDLLYMEKFL